MNLQQVAHRASRGISPAQHAVIDYAAAAAFASIGARLVGRHPRASGLAFLNSALVLGLSLFTDYQGGLWRVLRFKAHRTGDLIQAALAGVGPLLLGFGSDPEAKYFYSQAVSELGVIAATDWDGDTGTIDLDQIIEDA